MTDFLPRRLNTSKNIVMLDRGATFKNLGENVVCQARTVNALVLAATCLMPLSSSRSTKCTFCLLASLATASSPPPFRSIEVSLRALIVFEPSATDLIQSAVHFSGYLALSFFMVEPSWDIISPNDRKGYNERAGRHARFYDGLREAKCFKRQK